MSHINFNLSEYMEEEKKKYDLLPDGEYKAKIIETEIKKTKKALKANTDDSYLNIKLLIVEGPYINRYVWDRLNIYNENKQAELIGRSRLALLATLCAVPDLTDSSQLNGKEIGIRIAIKKDDKYDDSNIVKTYMPLNKIKVNSHIPYFHVPSIQLPFEDNQKLKVDDLNDDIPF